MPIEEFLFNVGPEFFQYLRNAVDRALLDKFGAIVFEGSSIRIIRVGNGSGGSSRRHANNALSQSPGGNPVSETFDAVISPRLRP